MSPKDAELNMLLLPIIQLMVIYINCNSLHSSKESVITQMCLVYFFFVWVQMVLNALFCFQIPFMTLHFSRNQFSNFSRGILRATKMSHLFFCPETDICNMQLLPVRHTLIALFTLAIKVKPCRNGLNLCWPLVVSMHQWTKIFFLFSFSPPRLRIFLPSVKLICWVELLNKWRKLQCIWHGFLNGI